MKRNPHEVPPGTLARAGGFEHMDRVQRRAEELLEEYGSIDKVPPSMRGIIKKAKRFSHKSERPKRERK